MLNYLLLVAVSFAAAEKGAHRFPAGANLNCESQVEAFLKSQNFKGPWKRVVDPQIDIKAFRAPTENIAHWVELQTFADPVVYVYTEKGIATHKWKAAGCEKISSTMPVEIDFLKKQDQTSFDDHAVKKLLQTKKPAMIYAWSPAMGYSMDAMSIFAKEAEKRGMVFLPVVDPTVEEDVVMRAIQERKLNIPAKKLSSIEVFMRDVTIHYPAALIVNNGKISERIIGAMKQDQLEQEINQRLAEMAKGE